MPFFRSCLSLTTLLCVLGQPALSARLESLPATLAQAGGSSTDLRQQGETLYQASNFKSALELFRQAEKAATTDLERVDALNAQGKTLLALGDYVEAQKPFQAAAELAAKQKDRQGARQRGDLTGMAAALNGLGSALESLGEYEASEDAYNKLLKLAQDRGDRPWLATSLKGLLQVSRSSGNTQNILQAISFYEQVLGYTRQLQDRAGEAETLLALGFAYRLVGNPVQAAISYQQALELYQTLKHPEGIAAALEGLGSNDSDQQRYGQAVERYQQALEVRQQLGDRPLLATTLVELGKAYTASGQAAQAIPLHQQSLTLAQELKAPALITNALTHLGGAQLRTGQAGAAVTTLQTAVQQLEALRVGLTDQNKISIFERQKVAYSYLQQALVAQKQVEAALEVAERGRARAFVELLAKGLPRQQLGQLSANPPTIAQIKQVAKEQQATLVEYSTLENQEILIWVVSPSGQVTLRQSNLQTLGKGLDILVANSRAAMGIRGRMAFQEQYRTDDNPIRSSNESLRQWHQLLIEPIADLLPSDPKAQVVFIPQQGLFFVPFAAFQDADNKFLIEKHTIRIAPSIQVLAFTRQQRQRLPGGDRPFLLVGNPEMPLVRPPNGGARVQLSSLPGAEAEAKEISKLLQVDALLGKQANKERVMNAMPKSRLIHLATHGLLDIQDGGIPGAIALAPDNRDADAQNRWKRGLLTARDIASLKLQAELVVLSACDTGRGRITGDGVIGLSRSLIAAGSPSVIVSLWAVPDAPTAALMVSFYKNLQPNPDKAQALRQAMLETLKNYPDPLSWAAFVLIGEA